MYQTKCNANWIKFSVARDEDRGKIDRVREIEIEKVLDKIGRASEIDRF